MKKKYLRLISVTLAVVIFTLLPAGASESTENSVTYGSKINGIDYDGSAEALSAYMLASSPEDAVESISALSAGSIFQAVCETVAGLFAPVMKSLAGVAVCIILSGIIGIYTRDSRRLSGVCRFSSAAMSAGLIYGICAEAFETAGNAISSLTVLISGISPALLALCAFSGEVSSSSLGAAGTALLIQLLERFSSDGLFSLLKICFALGVSSAISGEAGLDFRPAGSLAASAVKLFGFGIGLVMLIFTFSLGMQSFLAKSADGVMLKSVKFASGSFVPVIGGSLSEIASTLFAEIGFMKASAGSGIVLAMLTLMLAPLTELLLLRLGITLCRLLAEALGENGIGRVTADAGSIVTLLNVLLVCVEIMAVFSVIMLCRSASAV